MQKTVTQPSAISITDARAEELQMWLRRGHLTIDETNPGRGKSRNYTSTDCAKIAVMVRLFRFGVEADRVGPVISYVENRLKNKSSFQWDEYFVITFHTLGNARLGNYFSADPDGVSRGMTSGDMEDLRISSYSEWFRSIEHLFGTGKRRDGGGRIIPEARDKLAELGGFAEPFLFFPIGEIVNGTLAKFDFMVSEDPR